MGPRTKPRPGPAQGHPNAPRRVRSRPVPMAQDSPIGVSSGPTAQGLAIASSPIQAIPDQWLPGHARTCPCDACTLTTFGPAWIPPKLKRRPGDKVATIAALPMRSPDWHVRWQLRSATGEVIHIIEALRWRDWRDESQVERVGGIVPAGCGKGVLYIASTTTPQPFAFWYSDVADGVPGVSVEYMQRIIDDLAFRHMRHLDRVVWRESGDGNSYLAIVGPNEMTPDEAEAERAGEIVLEGREIARTSGRDELRSILAEAYLRDRTLEARTRANQRRQADASRKAKERAEISGRRLVHRAPTSEHSPYLAPSLQHKRTATDRVYIQATAWLGFSQPEIREVLAAPRPSRKDRAPRATTMPERRIREFLEPIKAKLASLGISPWRLLGAAGRRKR